MILIRDDEVSGRAGSPWDQMARLRNRCEAGRRNAPYSAFQTHSAGDSIWESEHRRDRKQPLIWQPPASRTSHSGSWSTSRRQSGCRRSA